jgi:putative tricarboxylic transport membrane protein
METILQGLVLIVSFKNITAIILGIIYGVILGAIPGLTATMGIALAIPFTFYMEPVTSLSFLLGTYKGGIYGGSISAILVSAPGTPAAAATVLDGYELTKKGQSGKALSMALYASVIGDMFSVSCLFVIAPPLAALALLIGPVEFCFIIIFSLTVIATISGQSMIRGLISATFGFLLGTVGLDPILGSPRFTFGSFQMENGFQIIPLLIGLFAVSEIMTQGESRVLRRFESIIKNGVSKSRLTLAEFKSSIRSILRSSTIGTAIGAIPGIGAAVACFVCYGRAKAASKHPEEFGKGSLEGVAAAEAGNNATVGGALIPMLTLGIPGDIVTAILLTGFLVQGLFPGPSMFKQNGDVVYALFFGLFIGNLFLLVIGHFFIKGAVTVTKVPTAILYPVIFVFCMVGSYAMQNNLFDVGVMVAFGLLGYVMRKAAFPLAPLLIAFILGPILERSLRQALITTGGEIIPFFKSPISIIFLVLTILTILKVVISEWRRKTRDSNVKGSA